MASETPAPRLVGALPPGSHLIHIGPQKTGTTAVQAALHAARPQLAAHGVVLPGTAAKPSRAVQAGLGFGMGRGGVRPRRAAWDRFLDDVRGAGPDGRVCISLESFGRATGERLTRIVETLGGERPHVLMAARRYDALLPSQWQQRIKAGKTWSFEEWLRLILDGDSGAEHGVWVPHDTVGLVDRWARAVGTDNLTVVAIREGDRRRVLDCLEDLLDLPRASLVPPPAANRSLSHQEVELLRAVNQRLRKVRHAEPDWHAMVSRGVIPALGRRPFPPGDAAVPPLPAWALGRLQELSERRIEGLAASGARIVGDLADLRLETDGATHAAAEVATPARIAIDTAALAVSAAVAGGARRARRLESLAGADRRVERAARRPRRRSG